MPGKKSEKIMHEEDVALYFDPLQWQKIVFSPMIKFRFMTVTEYMLSAGVSETMHLRDPATHPYFNSWKTCVHFGA